MCDKCGVQLKKGLSYTSETKRFRVLWSFWSMRKEMRLWAGEK